MILTDNLHSQGLDSEAPCAESLAVLAAVDPFTLSAADRVALLVSLEQHAAWLDAVRATALAAVVGPGPEFQQEPVRLDIDLMVPKDRVEDAVREEVSSALRLSPVAAHKRIELARDLEYKLPRTRELLLQGVCTYVHAMAISQECERLNMAEAYEVEQRSLGSIATQTPSQTRRSVCRAAARVSPQLLPEVVEEEFAKRDVQLVHDGGIMATITATLLAPDALEVWNALTAFAVRASSAKASTTMASSGQLSSSQLSYSQTTFTRSNTSTMGRGRADALVSWARRVAQDPSLPTMQGKRRLESQIVIDLPTLLGLADNPGELIGYGPIPAFFARELAAESGSWRRLVTDPVTGHLLDYGSTTYTPPAALREFIMARDRVCQFPSCSQAAYRCDLDHVEPFAGTDQGGSTSADNLIALCRRHHRLKTHHNWEVAVDLTEQEINWTSPRGYSYKKPRPNLNV
ncbi:MAG: DUF222 domain-containing protein [Candidatus Nanopelagicales bacterium]